MRNWVERGVRRPKNFCWCGASDMGVRAKLGKLFPLAWCAVPRIHRLSDTRKNQQRCEAFLKVIEGEIELGTFDYRKHLPRLLDCR